MKNRNKGTLREKEKAEEAIRVEGKTSTKVRVVEIWDGEFVREIATCEKSRSLPKASAESGPEGSRLCADESRSARVLRFGSGLSKADQRGSSEEKVKGRPVSEAPLRLEQPREQSYHRSPSRVHKATKAKTIVRPTRPAGFESEKHKHVSSFSSHNARGTLTAADFAHWARLG